MTIRSDNILINVLSCGGYPAIVNGAYAPALAQLVPLKYRDSNALIIVRLVRESHYRDARKEESLPRFHNIFGEMSLEKFGILNPFALGPDMLDNRMIFQMCGLTANIIP